MKVNLMIIGAMKCGTSTLAGLIGKHPQICFSKVKETGFFVDENWATKIDKYHSLFNTKNSITYYAEGDTNYAKHALDSDYEIWERIHKYNTEVKFLYIVRNPIDRIISEYTHLFTEGYHTGKLEDIVFKNNNYLDSSSYYAQIIPFVNTFGRENVLILHFEDLINNQNHVLKNINDYLDIEEFEIEDKIHYNKSEGRLRLHYKNLKYNTKLRPMTKYIPRNYKNLIYKMLIPKERQLLKKPNLDVEVKIEIIKKLESDIQQFEVLTNKKYDSWRYVAK